LPSDAAADRSEDRRGLSTAFGCSRRRRSTAIGVRARRATTASATWGRSGPQSFENCMRGRRGREADGAPRCYLGRTSMLIKGAPDMRSSEITREPSYVRRREFIRLAGVALAGSAGALVAACNSTAVSAPVDDPVAGQTDLAGIKPKVVTT